MKSCCYRDGACIGECKLGHMDDGGETPLEMHFEAAFGFSCLCGKFSPSLTPTAASVVLVAPPPAAAPAVSPAVAFSAWILQGRLLP